MKTSTPQPQPRMPQRVYTPPTLKNLGDIRAQTQSLDLYLNHAFALMTAPGPGLPDVPTR